MINLILGGLLLVIGIANIVRPYKIARLEERVDAIGSRRSWYDVEPAKWKVTLTRLSGIAITLFGLLVFANI
ncbi:hypothetical protein [Halopiger djelfimassiliensis]|uniref:hypothetical protein n=1 Tax=Halopiger djelfimassiliensis TaxID=1293047 RepID=UPI00067778D1|nr:hypothetical protein [Halopiger djelfimassiliensis]